MAETNNTAEIITGRIKPMNEPVSNKIPELKEFNDFITRLMESPSSITQVEIEDFFGVNVPLKYITHGYLKSIPSATSKTPQASARQKLNRRLLSLEHALGETILAIDEYISETSQSKRVSNAKELSDRIESFMADISSRAPQNKVMSESIGDGFIDWLLSGGGHWIPEEIKAPQVA